MQITKAKEIELLQTLLHSTEAHTNPRLNNNNDVRYPDLNTVMAMTAYYLQ